jgi:hypothetical protein
VSLCHRVLTLAAAFTMIENWMAGDDRRCIVRTFGPHRFSWNQLNIICLIRQMESSLWSSSVLALSCTLACHRLQNSAASTNKSSCKYQVFRAVLPDAASGMQPWQVAMHTVACTENAAFKTGRQYRHTRAVLCTTGAMGGVPAALS